MNSKPITHDMLGRDFPLDFNILGEDEDLRELRRREAGHEPEDFLWGFHGCSPEFERLLLEYGVIGEVYIHIWSSKKSRWEAAEARLLEEASAGMLMSYMGSYMGIADISWEEANRIIEERFDEDHDATALAMHQWTVPDDLRARLVERVRLFGDERFRNTFERFLKDFQK